LVRPLIEHDAATALAELDATLGEGAEVGQLIDQLLGYFRDVMTQAVGCGENQLLYTLPGQRAELLEIAQRVGIQTLLAIAQVLDQTAARLRVSTQVRTLAEMAIVRICHLQDLDEITALIEQLRGGEAMSTTVSASAAVKKNAPASAVTVSTPRTSAGSRPQAGTGVPEEVKPEPRPVAEAAEGSRQPPSERVALDPQALEPIWKQTLERLTGIAADCAAAASKLSVDGQGRLVASFPESQKFARDSCLRPVNLNRIEAALSEVLGGRIGLVLTTHNEPPGSSTALPARQRPNPKQQQVDAAADPFVQKAVELFDADSARLKYIAPAAEE
jgi:DNA polymerase-3 subunit gamma/tau